MIEQIEKSDTNTKKNRKFVCRNVSYYDEDSLCRYIDDHIGRFPDDYEIISIVVKEHYFYLFFKQYIDDFED